MCVPADLRSYVLMRCDLAAADGLKFRFQACYACHVSQFEKRSVIHTNEVMVHRERTDPSATDNVRRLLTVCLSIAS